MKRQRKKLQLQVSKVIAVRKGKSRAHSEEETFLKVSEAEGNVKALSVNMILGKFQTIRQEMVS